MPRDNDAGKTSEKSRIVSRELVVSKRSKHVGKRHLKLLKFSYLVLACLPGTRDLCKKWPGQYSCYLTIVCDSDTLQQRFEHHSTGCIWNNLMTSKFLQHFISISVTGNIK